MLTAARTQIRANFREKATLPPSDPAIPDAIQHAEAVAAFLRANVVQGKREGNDGETYSTYNTVRRRGARSRGNVSLTTFAMLLELRIHEHTHRGDNDSIKSAGGGKELLDGGGCCSS